MGSEERVRAITALYYSNPKIQKYLLEFGSGREVVPRYFEGFGKRPDTLQYPSDIMGLVNKGATSFHASEEIWGNPLELSSEITKREMNDLRKSWDLLIDIDSPYLDFSKIAAKLLLEELEGFGIDCYGIKFSGSKGFHIIIPGEAFPKEIGEEKTKEMFPEFPRAVCEFLMQRIRAKYNKEVANQEINFKALEVRTKIKEVDIRETLCPDCGKAAKQGTIVKFKCPVCGMEVERKNPKLTKRRLKCLSDSCAGVLEVIEKKEFYHCEFCGKDSWDRLGESRNKQVLKAENEEEFQEGISGSKMADLDLVLVAPRHLFRMPYSLHEKTALASIVLDKTEIENFEPKMAEPMKVELKEFRKDCELGIGKRLLVSALDWKREKDKTEEKFERKRYEGKKFDDADLKGVTEDMFPKPIKKLLKGLEDGKKRGLFVLLTFLKSCGFSPDEINKQVIDWNKRNTQPLRDGYVKSQIDWHLKQRKKILPPNYDNDSFYRDLGLLDEKPKVKNPLVEVKRKLNGR